jgi:hypothetical protein
LLCSERHSESQSHRSQSFLSTTLTKSGLDKRTTSKVVGLSQSNPTRGCGELISREYWVRQTGGDDWSERDLYIVRETSYDRRRELSDPCEGGVRRSRPSYARTLTQQSIRPKRQPSMSPKPWPFRHYGLPVGDTLHWKERQTKGLGDALLYIGLPCNEKRGTVGLK